MGKGQRNRAMRHERPAHERLLANAARLDKSARVLCVIGAILLGVLLFLPAWSMKVISQNLDAALYTADEVAVLSPVVPLGQLSLVLSAIGTVCVILTLRVRRPFLSLIGMGLWLAAAAMLISFAVTVGDVFAFNPILPGGHGQGLSFWDLLVRYYSLLAPFIMQIVAVCMSFVAHKNRDLAALMQQADDTSSTLTLGEEDPFEPSL